MPTVDPIHCCYVSSTTTLVPFVTFLISLIHFPQWDCFNMLYAVPLSHIVYTSPHLSPLTVLTIASSVCNSNACLYFSSLLTAEPEP